MTTELFHITWIEITDHVRTTKEDVFTTVCHSVVGAPYPMMHQGRQEAGPPPKEGLGLVSKEGAPN